MYFPMLRLLITQACAASNAAALSDGSWAPFSLKRKFGFAFKVLIYL
jgi:hypothetical protein